MKLGSLCSGAGGLDMAVESVFGAETVWHCELDPAASKVLAHRWPGVPNHGDLTTTDWSTVEPVDIVCAGWPCQPWSLVGQRKGQDHDHAIWPSIAAAVRLLRPRIIVLENVSAVIVLGEFDRTITDLAEIGYDVRWHCLRASDIGAPHQRERLFIVADTAGAAVGEPARRSSTEETWENAGHGPGDHRGKRFSPDGRADSWGPYTAAIRQWERLTRPAPPPTVLSRNNISRLNPAFSEWMMGWPAGWVTDVPGLSRNDKLRIIGNGVVPAQAAAAVSWLLSLEAVA